MNRSTTGPSSLAAPTPPHTEALQHARSNPRSSLVWACECGSGFGEEGVGPDESVCVLRGTHRMPVTGFPYSREVWRVGGVNGASTTAGPSSPSNGDVARAALSRATAGAAMFTATLAVLGIVQWVDTTQVRICLVFFLVFELCWHFFGISSRSRCLDFAYQIVLL